MNEVNNLSNIWLVLNNIRDVADRAQYLLKNENYNQLALELAEIFKISDNGMQNIDTKIIELHQN
ncbi:MAG TPA: hypothetical protein GX522_03310 [Firmicutes bacterium]|nr:hypothetical protein [Bacillota bacterium]